MNNKIADLLNIMKILRNSLNGCEWDRQQTLLSLTSYTVEEVYELVDAIESNQSEAIKNELADLLYHLVFYAQIAQEQQRFDFQEIVQFCCEKLVRRHPKQFLAQIENSKEMNQTENTEAKTWAQMKQKERSNKKLNSILDDIPKAFPSLIRAEKIQQRAAEFGFDWQNPKDVFAKVQEECNEVDEVLGQPELDKLTLEEEIGDLLFSVVNLTRHYQLNAERVLQKATQKFERRFRLVEQKATAQAKNNSSLYALHHFTLAELEQFWQEVKEEEKTKDSTTNKMLP